jgi:hypothetical protein
MSECACRRTKRLKRHREEMQLAVAEGLTLAQARSRLLTERLHRTRLESEPPVAELDQGPPPPAPAERQLPYWLRD